MRRAVINPLIFMIILIPFLLQTAIPAYATVSENDPYPYKPYLSWQEQYYSGVQSTIGVMSSNNLFMIKGQSCYVGKGAASFDKKVVRIGRDGVARALKEGDSRLLITDYGSFDIKVIEPELSDLKADLTVGAQKKLSLIWNNRSIEDMGLKAAWQSDNQNVIQVISGNCVAVGRGKARVFATTGGIRYVSCITVHDDSKTEYVMNTRLGKKKKIAVPYAERITWTVKDTGHGNTVCSVDHGKMVGRLVGDTTVKGNEGHLIRAYVEDPFTPVRTIWLDLGEKRFISMNGIYEVPVWKSSRKTIASVSEYGVVIGERPGKCFVTCRIQGKSTRIKIVVSRDRYKDPGIPDSEKHWNWVKVTDALNNNEGMGVWVSDDGDLKYDFIPYFYFRVSFDSNGGSPVEPQNIGLNKCAVIPKIPKRNGHVFRGWYLEGEPYDFNTPVKHDITLKAMWEEVTFRIEYELNGGTNNADNPEGYSGERDIVIKPPVKKGYEFTGWTGSNGEVPEKEVLIRAGSEGDKHYTAHWSDKPIEYTITYDANGGTIGDAKQTYTVEDEDYILPTPVRNGYDFAGWTGSNGDVPEKSVTIQKGSTGDRIYKARWSGDPIVYSITYDTAGGTIKGNKTSYTVEDGDITLPIPEKAGYEFTGWSGSNGDIPERTVIIPRGSTGDKRYLAHWSDEPVRYSITYNLGGGHISGEKTSYTVEDDDFTLKQPTHEYGDFTGWTGSNGNTPQKTVTVKKGTTGDLTYTAHYSMQPGSLTINRGNGSGIFGSVMVGDTAYSASTTSFGVVEPGTKIRIIGTAGEHKSYSSENGGHDSEGAGLKYEYAVGFEFDMPETPLTVTLYRYDSSDSYGIEINKGTVAIQGLKNTTATVTFDCNGGTDGRGHASFDVVVERGVKVIKPDDPVRAGYVFDCWTTERVADNAAVTASVRYDFENDVGHSIKLYAHWNR